VLSEEDFAKVRTESTRVIDLAQFADESAIDPMYVDHTYYLAPDGKMAGSAFAVMREGMKGKVGIGKLALYGREYLVAVRPHQRGIVMHRRSRDVVPPARCPTRPDCTSGCDPSRRPLTVARRRAIPA
jgi:DNA end-binding protein Ku